jgi:zinc transporter, ZIP family
VLEAAFWGLVTAGSLLVGAGIALVLRPGPRLVGLTIAFGAGALVAAVAYELVLEAFETSSSGAAAGFVAGALGFYVGDLLIDRRGGHGRKSMEPEPESGLAGGAGAIVLGTVLDGIPESFVLGASLQTDGVVPVAVVVAVFVSNVPEALSATTGLRAAGWSGWRLMKMWSKVVAVSVLAAVAGWLVLDSMAASNGAFALGFAGGAVLVMLADTLFPEAIELGGREAGLLTALGFAVGFALSA